VTLVILQRLGTVTETVRLCVAVAAKAALAVNIKTIVIRKIIVLFIFIPPLSIELSTSQGKMVAKF
jgi:hypothetical protein